MKIDHLFEAIGNTPHLKLQRLFAAEAQQFPQQDLQCYVKMEDLNPGGSLKDRVAVAMIEDALASGKLRPGQTVIEPTSGNTGIGLAMACAALGFPLIIVLPASTSLPRQKIMAALGAQLELTPAEGGMKAAINRAQELQVEKNGVILDQFHNEANLKIHQTTTAQEILADFDHLDYLISGVGTSGHLAGVGSVLKKKFPALQIWAVEPAESAVLSGHSPGKHGIQGIGAGFRPQFFEGIPVERIITIPTATAQAMRARLPRLEGIMGGISTGAVLAAIQEHYGEFKPHSTILTFIYDRGERYLV